MPQMPPQHPAQGQAGMSDQRCGTRSVHGQCHSSETEPCVVMCVHEHRNTVSVCVEHRALLAVGGLQCLPCHDRGYDTTAAIVPR